MARILVTNDDGVDQPGIAALAVALHDAGHDVVVVAPMHERSGSGAAIGHLADGATIDVVAHQMAEAGHLVAYGVDGPPALCSLLGFFEVFGPKPELVLSGINPGANTGRGLLHSGTVGAVLTAADLGISGAAVSVDAVRGESLRFDTAAQVAVAVVDWLGELPRKTALNVNVPACSIDEVRGVRWGRIAAFGPFATSVVGEVPGTLTVQITPREVELKPDTDTALVHAGYVAVTALVTPRPTEPLDVASHLEARLR
ncbi:MAG TPA: 5'/3'-nucleotidase SurE [Acidimicrobiales bacterium]